MEKPLTVSDHILLLLFEQPASMQAKVLKQEVASRAKTTEENVSVELVKLKERGLATNTPRRGYWSLTQRGQEEASHLNQMRAEEDRSTDTSVTVDTKPQVRDSDRNGISSLFGDEMELVVYKDVHPAAAGDRSVIYYEEDKEILYVPKGFVLNLLGFAPPRSIGVCFIDGDSMSPTLEDGDMVLYRPEAQLDGGGVYMLLLDGALVAKRVQRIPGGGYHIISDNKFHGYKDAMLVPGDGAYSESLVNPETGRPVDMRVVGRIIWPRRSTDKLHIKQVTALIQGLMTGAPPNVPGL